MPLALNKAIKANKQQTTKDYKHDRMTEEKSRSRFKKFKVLSFSIVVIVASTSVSIFSSMNTSITKVMDDIYVIDDSPEVVAAPLSSKVNESAAQTKKDVVVAMSNSHEDDKYVDPPKTTAIAKCGEILQEYQETLDVVTNIIDLIRNNPVHVPKHTMMYNRESHNKGDVKSLLLKQSCLYDVLTRWNQLAMDLGISRWVVHGGSSIGAKCYGGMNPWDDDIDITVFDCQALDELWKNGEPNITSRHPTLDERSHSMNNRHAKWDSRLIASAGDDLILTRGDICCNWYKLLTVSEAFQWKPGDNIGGMDIECKSRGSSSREKNTQRKSNWTDYLQGTKELYIVPYGPTTIQVMDPRKLNEYIKLRYGKKSPCQFPFSSGLEIEKFPSVFHSSNNETTGVRAQVYQVDQDRAQMNFALKNWYVPKAQRIDWLGKKGNKKQSEYFKQLPNFDKIEIDNTISPGCQWSANATIKVIGWNAERGTHWDKFYKLIKEKDELNSPHVILLNEMDIGMARSGNIHTARWLALQLGMNYAYGVEFLELTRGTKKEQNITEGKRDALSLHGNAILTKCILGDGLIIRDPLPHTYFSDKAHRGINADGYEVRLGGRMGLFARIFEKSSTIIPGTHNLTRDSFHIPKKLPPHFVVGNVHKLNENAETRNTLWNFYGFGAPAANSTSIYDGKGVDRASSQHGVIIQGDFGPQFCSLGGLGKMNNYKIHKTFPSKCLPNGKSKMGPISGDFICTNMRGTREVKVTPPCDWSNNSSPLTLADHAIVSIEVESNKKQA